LPEGDTIFLAARTLNRVLAGRTVTQFDSVFPAINRVAGDRPLVGRTIESVTARGKHLLIKFSGDLVLHTHMRMNGSWHVYPAGARWRRPAGDMRVLIGTGEAVAVGFNVPVADLLTSREMARHPELRALGPDVLDAAFDRGEAVRRMRSHGGDRIADALLDQRIVAGLGNVFKSETLFLAGIDPFTPVASLDDRTLEAILDAARKTMKASVSADLQSNGRRTTRSLDPRAKRWVYGRIGGMACRCGRTPTASPSDRGCASFAGRLTAGRR